MNTLETSAIVFICIFGGALLGFWLRAVLPEDHLSPTSRDLVKLGMGTIATMTALVLGLLVASAKNNYDAQSRELTEMSAKIIVLDRVLSHYGPEAKEARDLLQVVVTRLIERTWPTSKAGRTMAEPSAPRSEVLYDKIQELVPTNDTQRSLQTRALNIAVDIGQMRWLMIEQGDSLAFTASIGRADFFAHNYLHQFRTACCSKRNGPRHFLSECTLGLWCDFSDSGDVHTSGRFHSNIQRPSASGACLPGPVSCSG